MKKVIFDLRPVTHADEQALHEHAQAHAIGEGAAGRAPPGPQTPSTASRRPDLTAPTNSS